MKLELRTVIVVVVLACAAGLWWMVRGSAAPDAAVGNSNVLNAVTGVAALTLSVVLLWRSLNDRGAGAAGMSDRQANAAVEYLAMETLRYWETQANDRRITTPSPAAVRWQWAGNDVAVSAPSSQTLTAGVVTQLREQLYERLDESTRVVILGGPGAGKTGAMLLLLLDVLKHRPGGSAQPVPIWLTLGGWNPQTTSLQEWAATTLTRDYPGLLAHGGHVTAGALIRTRRVAFFLDGLDELPPALQGQALQAIDREGLGAHLVLTSRPNAYQAALTQGRLWGAAVITLLPVDLEHAEEFLLAEQLDPHRQAWQHVIDHMRANPDSVPANTLTTPLALSLARETYTHTDPTQLLNTQARPTPDALLQHLLARSLQLAYPDLSQLHHATKWLGWIAQHMGTSRDLRWWDIPTWLPNRQRRLVLLLTGPLSTTPQTLAVRWPNKKESSNVLAAGLAPGLAVGVAVGLMVGKPFVFGLPIGLAFGLAGMLSNLLVLWRKPATNAPTATPVRIYRSTRRQARVSGLTFGIVFGLAVGVAVALVSGFVVTLAVELGSSGHRPDHEPGLAFGLVVTLADGLKAGPASEDVSGLAFGLASGLLFGLASGLAFGLAFALASGLVSGLAFGLMFGVAAGLIAGLSSGLATGLLSGLVVGLAVEILVSFMRLSGVAAVQLLAAGLILGLRGERAFLPLLETALERQVLRQVGSVYQFRHAALQELLIRMPLPEKSERQLLAGLRRAR